MKGPRILVVDHELVLAAQLADLLAIDGYEVEIASNGLLALDKLRAWTYALIFSEIHMPELDGLSLYRVMEYYQPHHCQRFIFMTGAALSPDTQAFLRRTGAPLLLKPVAGEELRRIVQQALAAHADPGVWRSLPNIREGGRRGEASGSRVGQAPALDTAEGQWRGSEPSDPAGRSVKTNAPQEEDLERTPRKEIGILSPETPHEGIIPSAPEEKRWWHGRQRALVPAIFGLLLSFGLAALLAYLYQPNRGASLSMDASERTDTHAEQRQLTEQPLAEEQPRIVEAHQPLEAEQRQLMEQQQPLVEEQRRFAEPQLAKKEPRRAEPSRRLEAKRRQLADREQQLAEAQRQLMEQQQQLAEEQHRLAAQQLAEEERRRAEAHQRLEAARRDLEEKLQKFVRAP